MKCNGRNERKTERRVKEAIDAFYAHWTILFSTNNLFSFFNFWARAPHQIKHKFNTIHQNILWENGETAIDMFVLHIDESKSIWQI